MSDRHPRRKGFDVELAGARDLICKDAMEFRIDAVRVHHDGDAAANGPLDRHADELNERRADDAHDLLVVTIDRGGDERLPAREILIERADLDAGDFGDLFGDAGSALS